jgi:ketosteroid isomerase-like protein
MHVDHLETVRRFADAVNRRDREAAFACMTPAIMWNATGELLDQKVHHQGREAVWGYLHSMDESFDGLRADVESVEQIAELVVARVHLHGTGRSSGVVADFGFSSVARFESGRIARVENFVDHDEAMNEAELRAAR